LLEEELEAVGIRLNKKKPKIYFKPKKSGGLGFNSMVPLTKIDEKLVHSILAEYSKRKRRQMEYSLGCGVLPNKICRLCFI
jgi:ribosome-interacting GTPase 1